VEGGYWNLESGKNVLVIYEQIPDIFSLCS